MKRTTLLIAATLAVVPTLYAQTSPTLAQIAERLVQRYAILLGLSSTQQEQALTIFTTEETSEAAIHTSERTAQQSLETAVKADNVATITQLSATLGELSGQSTLARSLADAQFYATLTSDQQTNFAQIMAHGPGGGFGGPGGPPPQH
jgi:hypothetical protein